MNKIKARFQNTLMGEVTLEMEAFLALQSELAEIIATGAENDADAILVGFKANGLASIVGVVGKSLIQGHGLKTYLDAYFEDAGGLSAHLEGLSEYFYDGLTNGTTNRVIQVLRSDDPKWRAFNPLKDMDEVIK
jgi:hypothetical protein